MSEGVIDCGHCNGRKSCPGKEWYSPSDIKFCAKQIVWLLENRDILLDGLYPADPATSGSVMPTIKTKGRRNAKFTTPIEIIAEVERRLEHCRLDGLLVLLYHAFDFEARELAKYYRCSEADILHRIESVIWKVSGWNFHPEYPYRRWLAYRDYENWKAQSEASYKSIPKTN